MAGWLACLCGNTIIQPVVQSSAVVTMARGATAKMIKSSSEEIDTAKYIMYDSKDHQDRKLSNNKIEYRGYPALPFTSCISKYGTKPSFFPGQSFNRL